MAYELMKINLKGDSVFWSNVVLNELYRVRERLSPVNGGGPAYFTVTFRLECPFTITFEGKTSTDSFIKQVEMWADDTIWDQTVSMLKGMAIAWEAVELGNDVRHLLTEYLHTIDEYLEPYKIVKRGEATITADISLTAKYVVPF